MIYQQIDTLSIDQQSLFIRVEQCHYTMRHHKLMHCSKTKQASRVYYLEQNTSFHFKHTSVNLCNLRALTAKTMNHYIYAFSTTV